MFLLAIGCRNSILSLNYSQQLTLYGNFSLSQCLPAMLPDAPLPKKNFTLCASFALLCTNSLLYTFMVCWNNAVHLSSFPNQVQRLGDDVSWALLLFWWVLCSLLCSFSSPLLPSRPWHLQSAFSYLFPPLPSLIAPSKKCVWQEEGICSISSLAVQLTLEQCGGRGTNPHAVENRL